MLKERVKLLGERYWFEPLEDWQVAKSLNREYSSPPPCYGAISSRVLNASVTLVPDRPVGSQAYGMFGLEVAYSDVTDGQKLIGHLIVDKVDSGRYVGRVIKANSPEDSLMKMVRAAVRDYLVERNPEVQNTVVMTMVAGLMLSIDAAISQGSVGKWEVGPHDATYGEIALRLLDVLDRSIKGKDVPDSTVKDHAEICKSLCLSMGKPSLTLIHKSTRILAEAAGKVFLGREEFKIQEMEDNNRLNEFIEQLD